MIFTSQWISVWLNLAEVVVFQIGTSPVRVSRHRHVSWAFSIDIVPQHIQLLTCIRSQAVMAGSARSTPASNPPTLKKSTSTSMSSSQGQKTIVGFFQKKSMNSSIYQLDGLPPAAGTATRGPSSSLTPAPSSDALEEPESFVKAPSAPDNIGTENGLPSPTTPANAIQVGKATGNNGSLHYNSPSRKVSQSSRFLAFYSN